LSDGEFTFNGNHLDNLTNSDVNVIWISRSLTPFVITQFFDVFSEATAFRVESSNLEVLPENLFENALNVQQINFNNNPLEAIQAGAFSGAVSLNRLDLALKTLN
jgi:hypothetical protein